MIIQYSRETITQGEWKVYSGTEVIDYKTQEEWKIQLTMVINFVSSRDSDEILIMGTKSHNIEIMMGNEINEIIEELFESLLQKYQEELKENMRGSDLSHYNLHKINLRKVGSYIDSPEWLKNKKAPISSENNDDKCFQYALTVALNYEQIKKDTQRISKIKLFIDQYNWKKIFFPSHRKDWKKFELSNKSIALHILYVPHNTKEIRHTCKSKYKLKGEN